MHSVDDAWAYSIFEEMQAAQLDYSKNVGPLKQFVDFRAKEIGNYMKML